MSKKRGLSVMAAMLLPLVLLGVGLAGGKQVTFMIPDFRNTPEADFDKATDENAATFQNLVGDLIAELRKPGLSDAAKIRIIYLLGEFRAVKATNVLIENFNLKDVNVNRDRQWQSHIPILRWGNYPAWGALTKLGHYGSGAIMDTVGNTVGRPKFEEKSVDGYAQVIYAVEGSRYGLMKLQDRLDKAKDEGTRKQFEQVIQRFKEWDAGMQH